MNRILSKIAWSFLATCMLTACGSSDEEWHEEELETTARITVKAADDSSGGLQAGGSMGVFSLTDDGVSDVIRNQQVTVGEGGSAIFSTGNLQGTFLFYSPYQSTWEHALESNPQFDVLQDQSTAEGYYASDLMIGQGQAGGQAVLNHMLARVVVHVVDEIGAADFDGMKVTMLNRLKSCSVVLKERRVETFAGSECDIQMYAYDHSELRLSYEAIVVPQSVAVESEWLELVQRGSSELIHIPQSAELEGGKTFIYRLRITQKGIVFDGSSITNWEDAPSEQELNIKTD